MSYASSNAVKTKPAAAKVLIFEILLLLNPLSLRLRYHCSVYTMSNAPLQGIHLIKLKGLHNLKTVSSLLYNM